MKQLLALNVIKKYVQYWYMLRWSIFNVLNLNIIKSLVPWKANSEMSPEMSSKLLLFFKGQNQLLSWDGELVKAAIHHTGLNCPSVSSIGRRLKFDSILFCNISSSYLISILPFRRMILGLSSSDSTRI